MQNNIPDWMTEFLTDELQICGKADAQRLADITANAFKNDPVNKWIFKTEAGMRVMFHTLAKHAYGPHGICYTIGDDAAAMWKLSGVEADIPAPVYPGLTARIIRHSGVGAMGRILAIDKVMREKHPKKQHLYLFTVGVRQDSQGKGLGRRILAPMLKACDAAGMPVYLENSNPDNRGFYGAHGFKRMELFSATPDAPPLEAMWRDPQSF